MNSVETVQAELAADHAERCAKKLEEKGVTMQGSAALRMFAGALRAGNHLRPSQSEAEAEARAVAVVQDVIRQADRS